MSDRGRDDPRPDAPRPAAPDAPEPRPVAAAPAGADGPPHGPNAFEIVWRSPWVRAIVYAVGIVLLVLALRELYDGFAFALQIAVIGFVIAYILNPVVEAFGRIRIGRALATVIVYVALVNLIVLGSVLFAQVVAQLALFIGEIPEALERIGASFVGLQAWFERLLSNLPGFLQGLGDRFGFEVGPDEELALQIQERFAILLQNAADALLELLESLAREGPSVIVTGATSIISATLQVLLVLIAGAYFLYDFPRFTANFRRLVPVRYRPVYADVAAKADRAVGGYLRGQLLITGILGILIYLGLLLVGVPLALAISFLAAIFNLVPYLGPIIGVVPAVLLGFTVSPLTALLAIVVFVVANQLEGNVLSPVILSKSVDLHPVTVLIAITAGLGLAGFVGALLAVPLVALVKLVAEEYLLSRPAYREGALPSAGEADEEPPGRGGSATPV